LSGLWVVEGRQPARTKVWRQGIPRRLSGIGSDMSKVSVVAPRLSVRVRGSSDLFEPPDIDLWDDETLRDVQEESGAVFEGASTVPERYKSDLDLTYENVAADGAFCDRSNCTILQVSGEDRLDFLHNQSTATISGLAQGNVVDTVFVTAKAGIVDLATIIVQKNSVLVLASPGSSSRLLDHLNKHIFPRDDVRVTDISDKLCTFVLLGNEIDGILKYLGMKESIGENRVELVNFEGYPLCIAHTSGLSKGMPGYTWLVDSNISVDVWKLLCDKILLNPIGSTCYERLRLWDGKPAAGQELSVDYNPLEAGLLHCLDMEKGCSIGQEMIKKLYNRNGILKRLWGLTSDKPMEIGEAVLFNERKIGVVTSAGYDASDTFIALAYLKMQINRKPFSADNETVLVGGNEATVRALEYVEYPVFPEEERTEEEVQEDALEEEKREQKKAEMKARMEEWLKQSKQGQ